MTNQIISRRLALANNPDEPIVGVGGFFNSNSDLFLDSVTNSDGNPRKKLTEEEKIAEEAAKKEEQTQADKKPSELTGETISANQTTITNNSLQIAKLKKDKDDIVNKYYKLGARQGFVEGLQAVGTVVANVFRNNEQIAEAAEAEAATDALEKAKDAELAIIQKEIDSLQAINNQKSEENLELYRKKNEEAKKEETDAEENKKSALSNNLAKIDVLPKPEITKLPAESIGNIADIDTLKTTFAIYCLNDEPFFDRMKNDAFKLKKGTGTLSHPLPIKYNFKIMGTSGIRRGDTFNVYGIPEKYRIHGLFQVTQIEQNLEGMSWTTNITGEYRQKN